MRFKDKNAVVLGGSDGIGRATTIRLLNEGANVISIGRSQEKFKQLLAECGAISKNLKTISLDLSLLSNIDIAISQILKSTGHIDILLLSIGTIIPKKSFTKEGIESNFAISFLSRFRFVTKGIEMGLVSQKTKIVNIAASSPKIPSIARVDFNDARKADGRYGMAAHGAAQIANDLFVNQLAKRFSIEVIGYGPGSVSTEIRRELPPLFVKLMTPLFYFSTRSTQEVAEELVNLFDLMQGHQPYPNYFAKGSFFEPDQLVVNELNGNNLWSYSENKIKQRGELKNEI